MVSVLRDLPGSGAATPTIEPAELIAELAAAVLRRWPLVLIVTAVLMSGVYVAMQARSDIYQVEARLLVKVGPENLEIPTTVSRGALISSGVRKEDINSDVILLESRHLIEHAVDTLGIATFRRPVVEPTTFVGKVRRAASNTVRGVAKAVERTLTALRLAKPMSERDKMIERLQDNLVVNREGESDVIEISLHFGDGSIAVSVVDLMIDQFLIDRAHARSSIATAGFFEDQVGLAWAALERVDAEIATLRIGSRLTASADERKLLLERRSAVASSVTDATAAQASVQPIRAFADRIDPARVDPAAMGGAPYGVVLQAIGELMVKRTAEIGQVAASGRAAQEIEERIGALVLLLEQSVAHEIFLHEAERARIDERLEVLNVADQKMLLLLSEREVAQSRYDDYNLRLEEERVNARLEERRLDNIAVLTPPAQPLAPVGPRRLGMSLVSLPLGLIFGVALAGMLGYADTRVFGLRDLARIPGVKVLGEVSPAELRA